MPTTQVSGRLVLGLLLLLPSYALSRMASFVADLAAREHFTSGLHLAAAALAAVSSDGRALLVAGALAAGLLGAVLGGRALLVVGAVGLVCGYLSVAVGVAPTAALSLTSAARSAEAVAAAVVIAEAIVSPEHGARLAVFAAWYAAGNAGDLGGQVLSALLLRASPETRLWVGIGAAVASASLAIAAVILLPPTRTPARHPRVRPEAAVLCVGALVVYLAGNIPAEAAPFSEKSTSAFVYLPLNPLVCVISGGILAVAVLALSANHVRVPPVWIVGGGLVAVGLGAGAVAAHWTGAGVALCALGELTYSALTAQAMDLLDGRRRVVMLGAWQSLIGVATAFTERSSGGGLTSPLLMGLAALALLTAGALLTLGDAATRVVEPTPD